MMMFLSILIFPDHDPFLIESINTAIFQYQENYLGFDLKLYNLMGLNLLFRSAFHPFNFIVFYYSLCICMEKSHIHAL